MKNIVIALLTGMLFLSCSSPEKKQHAREKYDEAVRLYSNSLVFLTLNNDTIEKVITILDESIADDPKYADPYTKKASMLSKLGRNEEGLEVMNAAIKKIGEDNVDLLIQRVILYEKLGREDLAKPDYDKLMEIFDEMLKQDPDNFYALSNKAVVIGLSKNADAGLRELEKISHENLSRRDQVQLKFLKNTLNNSTKEEIIEKMDI